MAAQNKTALVTGSTSGMGLACARALAKRGVNIIVTGFGDETLINSIVDEIKGYGVRANYVSADLSKVTEIEALWLEVTQLYPDGIDILVNNAGLFIGNLVENISDEEWDLQIAVLLSAPFHFTKRCLPGMKKKGWGRIVNVASIAGLIGINEYGSYMSAKHGLIGLTKAVALENATHGITCNAICPASTVTPMLQKAAEKITATTGQTVEAVLETFAKAQPTGILIQPEQIGELVEFLCLSGASSQITGAVYTIDGGYTAQ